jgi:hypothetical protein
MVYGGKGITVRVTNRGNKGRILRNKMFVANYKVELAAGELSGVYYTDA